MTPAAAAFESKRAEETSKKIGLSVRKTKPRLSTKVTFSDRTLRVVDAVGKKPLILEYIAKKKIPYLKAVDELFEKRNFWSGGTESDMFTR